MTQTPELKAGAELTIRAEAAGSRGYEGLDIKERSQLNRRLRYANMPQASYVARINQAKPAYRA